MAEKKQEIPGNFIHDIIDADLASGKHVEVITRFPPEPNGFLHIGHAKSIVLNFGTAEKYGGRCHLRFDDTNPLTEETEYVEAIQRDVKWLGYDWGEHLYFGSDFFEEMYDRAEHLIKRGLAYVDSQSLEEIRKNRGTVQEAGVDSPDRDRPIEESLDLFRRMRAGEFEDGTYVLRGKIDMGHPNMLMRDPLLYRIRHATHHNTGDEWCIYPMYDYAHCLEDAFEGITHSLCSLEFENNRAVYDWVIEETEVPWQPQQIEFARLFLDYTVMSKRKLARLVDQGIVDGWDDPRLPTLAGLRRRGVTPSAIRSFCNQIGVTKANSRVEYEFFEGAIRDDLNMKAPRVMAVLEPLKVVLTNYPEDQVEWLEASYYPHDVPLEGSRKVPFTRELYIEREDFSEEPPKGWRRLSPGAEVRLRYGYYVTCQEVIKDEDGQVIELRCTYDPETRGGDSADGRKVQGTIHWVSATEGVECEVRLYDRLFTVPNPEEDREKTFEDFVNPDSLVVLKSVIEPSVVEDDLETRYQFERQGYFWQEQEESSSERLIFNRIVSLRDTWSRIQAEKAKAEEAERRRQREEAAARAAAAQAAAGETITERDRVREGDQELAQKYEDYQKEWGLNEEVADILSGDRAVADYFEEVLTHYDQPGSVGPWLVNEVLHRVEEGQDILSLGLEPESAAQLVEMIDADRISTQISRDVLETVLESGKDPETVVAEEGLEKIQDESVLEEQIDAVLEANPDEVQRYRDGNKRLLGFFIGQVMKATGGTADAKKLRELLNQRLG